MSQKKIDVIAIVRGCAFALITLIYINLPIHNYLWCVYVGFFLTMALGTKQGAMPKYICSLLAGYVWGILYLKLGGWVQLFVHIDIKLLTAILEFILTGSLLFIHLTFLQKTWFSVIPAVFAAVATLFAFGNLQSLPWCCISVVTGILMAFGTGYIIDKITGDS